MLTAYSPSMDRYKQLDKAVYFLEDSSNTIINGVSSNSNHATVNSFLDRFGKCVALVSQIEWNGGHLMVFEQCVEKRLLSHLSPFLSLSHATLKKQDFYVIHAVDLECVGIKIPYRVGNLILVNELPLNSELPYDEYTVFRVEKSISVQGIDFDLEMFLNVNWREAVSFTKGCYLGQEIIARVSNLGKPPKKLVRVVMTKRTEEVTLDTGVKIPVTSLCYSLKRKKYLGFVLVPRTVQIIQEGELLD